MEVEFETNSRKRAARASIPEDRSRPRTRRRPAIALILIAVVSAGCATSNYDFGSLSKLSGQSRAERLSEDWKLENEDGKERDLYDVGMLPLVCTHVNVFSKADEEGIPAGFVEADIDAYLPLFGFVDGTVTRYDSDHKLYERHEFNSYLWGLFQRHREQVDTKLGLREKKSGRFLWIFGWRSSPKYVNQVSEVSSE